MKQLIYSIAVVVFVWNAVANDIDSLKTMLSNTEVGCQLLELNTPDADQRAKVEAGIRAGMEINAPRNTEDSPRYRGQVYAYGAEMIRRDPAVSFEVKRFIADILAEGIVNDNSDYQKAKVIETLARVLGVTGPDILSDNALANIQKGFEHSLLPGRGMILLAYRAELEGAPKRIEAISRAPFLQRNGFLNKSVWTALLTRVWDGDGQALDSLLEYARKEKNIITRVTFIFKDLSTVHNQKCVEFFVPYLNSDERTPEVIYEMPGTPVASYAASALYQMLEGFPESIVQSGFQADEDIKRCREWVKQQKQFKFREKPLTEEQKKRFWWANQNDSL